MSLCSHRPSRLAEKGCFPRFWLELCDPTVCQIVFLALVFLSFREAFAGDAAPHYLASGKAFQQQLARVVSLSWKNLPLSQALASLSRAENVAIWLDRRVDPGQLVDLTISDETVEQVVQKIAAEQKLGVAIFSSVVYLGPRDAAEKLRTLAQLHRDQLKRIPLARRNLLLGARAWRWPALATPRDLLANLAKEGQVELRGLEQVPHDLWPERDLPAMALIDRLTLVAIQFGLSFHVAEDGKSITLVPVAPEVTATRTFPIGGESPTAMLEHLTAEFPQVDLEQNKGKIVARGRVEDLEAIADLLAGKVKTTKKPSGPTKQVFKLTAEQSVRGILADLAKRLDLDFQLNQSAIDAAGISLDQIVKVDVANATLEELIDAALRPAGLKATRDGRKFTVEPAR